MDEEKSCSNCGHFMGAEPGPIGAPWLSGPDCNEEHGVNFPNLKSFPFKNGCKYHQFRGRRLS